MKAGRIFGVRSGSIFIRSGDKCHGIGGDVGEMSAFPCSVDFRLLFVTGMMRVPRRPLDYSLILIRCLFICLYYFVKNRNFLAFLQLNKMQ